MSEKYIMFSGARMRFDECVPGHLRTDDVGNQWLCTDEGWTPYPAKTQERRPAQVYAHETIMPWPSSPWPPGPLGVTTSAAGHGHNPKHAAGSAKPPLHLVPMTAVILEAMVFKLGAKKYGPFNWRTSAVVRSIYLDAAMRHLMALLDGQDLDEESGQPHEAHIRACMAVLLDARAIGKLIDDRDAAGPAPKVLKENTIQTI
jgi:Domain of unknown function (DUF5664)